MSSIRVYVDLDDVYDGMDRNDKMRMAEWLYDDNILESHTNPQIRGLYREQDSYMVIEHKKGLNNIWEKYYIMSDEDLKLIEEISKKY
jgi:hypothetical protein